MLAPPVRRLLLLFPPFFLALPLAAQIIPKDAAVPVEVRQAKGAFAGKLHGAAMPTGKGWKAVMDPQRILQIMVPDRWKVISDPDGDSILKIVPPGQEKRPDAVLMVLFQKPRDVDPLKVDERFAADYAESLPEDPELRKLKYELTDQGFVLARGMRFALAGGRMQVGKGKTVWQQQLIFISEDRIITLQFTASDAEYSKNRDAAAAIFASYQTLGERKAE